MTSFLAASLAAPVLFLFSASAAFAIEENETTPQPDLICGRDIISPVLIDHSVDEIFAASVLQERFSFLDYHFEKNERYLQARAYLDDIETVVIYGPYESRDSLTPVSDDAFKGEVVAYLKRRFSRIEESSGDEAFDLVWEWSAEETPDLSQCDPIANNQE